MVRNVLVLGLMLSLYAAPAAAQDIGNAIDYIQESVGEDLVEGYEDATERERHDALAMLTARDVTVGKPLEDYDCWDAPIDGDDVMRTSGEQHWATRACHEYKFRGDNVHGYREIGDDQMSEREVAALVRGPAATLRIPPTMIITLARFASGFRPRALSERGHKGLLQLREDNLEAVGIRNYGDLMDPAENIRVGCEYYARLTVRTGGYMGALTAWHEGLYTMVKHGWNGNDPKTLWFIREVDRFFFAERDNRFPHDIAAESMTFIWNWME